MPGRGCWATESRRASSARSSQGPADERAPRGFESRLWQHLVSSGRHQQDRLCGHVTWEEVLQFVWTHVMGPSFPVCEKAVSKGSLL